MIIYCSMIGFDEMKYLHVCELSIERISAAMNGYLKFLFCKILLESSVLIFFVTNLRDILYKFKILLICHTKDEKLWYYFYNTSFPSRLNSVGKDYWSSSSLSGVDFVYSSFKTTGFPVGLKRLKGLNPFDIINQN